MRIVPILLFALALAACAAMPGNPARNRVVIQVSDNDPARWNLALNNARNLQADLGAANVEIEIVAYGPGLNMVKAGSAVSNRIDEAVLGGTNIVACENTMANQKVGKAEILPGVNYVGAGVVEIMRRQQQGWSYLRP
jgi:intracellular sulfur oxidation DsrE/DsrF family protein